MQKRLIHTVTALALTALSTLALADVPARVGRVALAQGNVSIAGEIGDVASAALVNWPVTSHNTLTTGRGARTEVRVGSTSIRLDGDSSLEIDELDDDSLRLRLNYGSASVRVVDPAVLGGFELSTPEALVRLREPGRLRVDAERMRDTTLVSVFDGLGLVDAGGGTIQVRAGKRVEILDDDIRTGLAARDNFDEWALGRDQYQDRSTSARYVTSDMTGYEDLDRYGAWRNDAEYGALWLPQVSSSWVPYRDGRWTWLDPWGWTWVDNAPWGYAPFHYGRWVYVNQRWAWAPGRHDGRPVWAPALVGWVGGSASFNARVRPAQGWYPLSPRERFVPGYRTSQDHIGRLNYGPRRGDDRRDGDQRRQGLTVLPNDQFGQRGQVVVPRGALGGAAVAAVAGAQWAATQAPRPVVLENRRDRFDSGRREERRRDDGRRDDGRRDDGRRDERNLGDTLRGAAERARNPALGQNMPQPRVPVTIATPPPPLPGTSTPRAPVMPTLPEPRQPVTITTPAPVMPNQVAPQQFERRDRGDGRRDEWRRDDGRRFQQAPVQQQPVQQAPVQQAAPPEAPRGDRGQRNEGLGGMMRGMAGREGMHQPNPMPTQIAPVVQPQRQAAPPAPPPPAAVAPAPAPAKAAEEHRGRGEGRRQQD